MAPRLRIRMYRVGFGDCFLVSLPQHGGLAHVLVDCGVHSAGSLGLMDDVVEDVARETGGRLHAVVATHEHQDHVSGFASASDVFGRLRVDETWLPWTSDPRNPQARRLRRKHAALAASLGNALKALKSRDAVAAREMAANARGNARAMEVLRSGFATSPRVRYLTAGQRLPRAAGIDGLDVLVLGPPRDEQALARMNPPKDQRYLRVDGDEIARGGLETLRPFPRAATVGRKDPAWSMLTDREREELREAASVDAGALAFALDKAINNTSLVLLLRHRGRTLLFPGDAQWGSWESWLAREDATDLLDDIDVIKVSHHGSHNGTPRSAVERLSGFYALASTQSKPWKSIPRLPLLDALAARSGTIVRSDYLPVKGSKGVKPPWKSLPANVTRGDFWFDLHLGAKR